jgi:hypothetical protein
MAMAKAIAEAMKAGTMKCSALREEAGVALSNI